MVRPEKTETHIASPVSKLKAENSSVFGYIDSLSPIKPIPIAPQALSSIAFASPPPPSSPLFTSSPRVDSHKESRFRRLHQTFSPNKETVSTGQDCITTHTVINDGGTDLQKMCDHNVKAKGETPDWVSLVPDDQLLIYPHQRNDTPEAAFLRSRPSNSQTRIATLETVLNRNESESSYTLPSVHRRRCLDFETPENKQPSSASSSSFGLHPNTIAFSSKDSKKRRKSEQDGGEGERPCKRCNCKKSKCLKLYCECFAAGNYCTEPCSCVECFNKPIHEDTVLATRKQIESRNPLAFAAKVIRNSDDDASKTPASARHKRGCNCKKSNCLKKYCECYQSGVGCSPNCRCEGCKNAFGTKCGIKKETSGESGIVKPQEKTELCNSVPRLPSKPMLLRQPLAQLPISSNNRLLSQHLHDACGSFRKQDMNLKSYLRIEKIREKQAGGIENQSPITKLNAVSPNNKRVSLPHLGSSGWNQW